MLSLWRAVLAFASVLLAVGGARGAAPVPILILHSYTLEYPWTKRQHEGFVQALRAERGLDPLISTESLDTKRRRYDAGYARAFADFLRFKYADVRPALIYVTDDNALLFARDHLAALFPDSPVFFSGVNDYSVRDWLDRTRMTGVFEKKEIAPNLSLLRHLDARARQIVLVGDDSNTYQAIEREARLDLADFPEIQATFVATPRMDELLDALRRRPEKYLILTTLGGLLDAQGRPLPLKESIARIVALRRFVILNMEDVYQFDGVLGGYVTNGEHQGERAARLALAFLHGTPVQRIAPILASPNSYLFDVRELERHGLSLPPRLPGEATLLNQPMRFFDRHRERLLQVIFALSATLFLVVLGSLAMATRRSRELQRRARQIEAQSEALRAGEESYHGLFDGIRETIYIQDENGIFVDANEGAERMYGYTREEIRGKSPAFLAAPGKNDLAAVAARFRLAWEGTPQHFAFWGRRKNGECFPKDVSLTKGSYFGREVVIAVAVDVSERHRAEEVLRESEATYRALFEASIDALSIIDPETGRFIDCNQAAVRLHDTGTREQFIGRAPESLSPEFQANGERSATLAKAYIQQAFAEGMATFEWLHCKADGTPFPVLVSFCAFGLKGKKHILAIGRDISEQKRAEAELRVAAIAFESQEAIVITDAEQVIQRVNPAFTKVTGYSAEEAVGRTPALLRSGHHEKAYYQAMWAAVRERGEWQGEMWNRRKSGEIYPEWLTITAVRDAAGKVVNYVGIFQDITERKSAEEKIRNLAFYDALTQLPNRRLLLDRLQQAVAASSRGLRHGALLFIDLDNFKLLNDTQGHDVGDLLLINVARRLQECVREGDSVARLGGDEFVVMLENLDECPTEAANQAEGVALKIHGLLNQPYELGSLEHHSTPSIGVALFRDKIDALDDLLKRADLAMYQAKASGRNTIRFFDPAMQSAVEARSNLEAEMRRAILRGDFILHYQPQVCAEGRITGVEALVRWRHPERGLISPQFFIALAEETGLIIPIGQQVLQQACEQLKAWSGRAGSAHLSMSVNVSARQFLHPDFIDMVEATLDAAGIGAGGLMLEITESLLLENVDAAVERMNALKARGLRFSIDDFGTGYSSLAYLKRLPLDELKIDRSFVADIEHDDNAAAICAAFISLANILGLHVVAEGVETEAQRHLLSRVHRCDTLQGYLFGKPMPADAIEALLTDAATVRSA